MSHGFSCDFRMTGTPRACPFHDFPYYSDMRKSRKSRTRISSTELARSIGEILGRVRFRGESFVIERNGKDVACLGPLPDLPVGDIRDVLTAWIEAGERDPELADQLEALDRQDLPAEDPWGPSSTRAP